MCASENEIEKEVFLPKTKTIDGEDVSSSTETVEEDFEETLVEEESAFEPRRERQLSSSVRCAITLIGCLSLLGAIVLGLILIGAAMENRLSLKAADTLSLYDTEFVCALDKQGTASTFESVAKAHASGQQVAHCGRCGGCSTTRDMTIYAETRNNLTATATICGFLSLVGMKYTSRCLEERVGFTKPCEQCWTQNIACTRANCKWTCLKYKLFKQSNNDGTNGDLNPCLKCDERLCGPKFLHCAGANRRQCGIISDIGRSAEDEQCQTVDIDWVTNR